MQAQIGDKVRVYIREKEFPMESPVNLGDGRIVMKKEKKKDRRRLHFKGEVKEIFTGKKLGGHVRFRNGYIVLKGRFVNMLPDGKRCFSEHKKIALSDISRILMEK